MNKWMYELETFVYGINILCMGFIQFEMVNTSILMLIEVCGLTKYVFLMIISQILIQY